MHVGDVMTRNVEVIGFNAPLIEAAAKMKTLDVGLIPVCDGDQLKGTVTDRDITVRGVAEGHSPSQTTVGDIMSTDLVYCFEDDEIEKALKLMETKQVRRLPVLSREKRLVGIVSIGDLAVQGGREGRVGETLKEVSEPASPKR